MNAIKRFPKGTEVIVDWADVGPEPCTVVRFNDKSIHPDPHYVVLTKHNKAQLMAFSSQVTVDDMIDLQYYREKRINKLLK